MSNAIWDLRIIVPGFLSSNIDTRQIMIGSKEEHFEDYTTLCRLRILKIHMGTPLTRYTMLSFVVV